MHRVKVTPAALEGFEEPPSLKTSCPRWRQEDKRGGRGENHLSDQRHAFVPLVFRVLIFHLLDVSSGRPGESEEKLLGGVVGFSPGDLEGVVG